VSIADIYPSLFIALCFACFYSGRRSVNKIKSKENERLESLISSLESVLFSEYESVEVKHFTSQILAQILCIRQELRCGYDLDGVDYPIKRFDGALNEKIN
jgi:hypothetical protein